MDKRHIHSLLGVEFRRLLELMRVTSNWVMWPVAPSGRHYQVGRDVVRVFCEVNGLMNLVRDLSEADLLHCEDPMYAEEVVGALEPPPLNPIRRGLIKGLANLANAPKLYRLRVDDLEVVVGYGLFEEWKLLPGEAEDEERAVAGRFTPRARQLWSEYPDDDGPEVIYLFPD